MILTHRGPRGGLLGHISGLDGRLGSLVHVGECMLLDGSNVVIVVRPGGASKIEMFQTYTAPDDVNESRGAVPNE